MPRRITRLRQHANENSVQTLQRGLTFDPWFHKPALDLATKPTQNRDMIIRASSSAKKRHRPATALIADSDLARRIIAHRRRRGIDQWDEVWDGVYIVSPLANNQHQGLGNDLAAVITICIRWDALGLCFHGCNVSDRKEEWTKNFRCPDVAVFLNGNPAEDCDDFWYNGPDFAVEVVSPRDRTRKKIPFYEKVGTRELMIVDRRPWRLSLLRLDAGRLRDVGQSTFEKPQDLRSAVIPLTFRLTGDLARPAIFMQHHDGKRQWTVEAMPTKPLGG
jgi:Uma2 family endonuclease